METGFPGIHSSGETGGGQSGVWDRLPVSRAAHLKLGRGTEMACVDAVCGGYRPWSQGSRGGEGAGEPWLSKAQMPQRSITHSGSLRRPQHRLMSTFANISLWAGQG
jgi:hypothetical protein